MVNTLNTGPPQYCMERYKTNGHVNGLGGVCVSKLESIHKSRMKWILIKEGTKECKCHGWKKKHLRKFVFLGRTKNVPRANVIPLCYFFVLLL